MLPAHTLEISKHLLTLSLAKLRQKAKETLDNLWAVHLWRY